MVESRETQRCRRMVAVFWQKKSSGVLRQLCVHNYNNYDYDDENNKRYLFHIWMVFVFYDLRSFYVGELFVQVSVNVVN